MNKKKKFKDMSDQEKMGFIANVINKIYGITKFVVGFSATCLVGFVLEQHFRYSNMNDKNAVFKLLKRIIAWTGGLFIGDSFRRMAENNLERNYREIGKLIYAMTNGEEEIEDI